MQHVEFAPLARSVSRLGFGCASLGSRVDAKHGEAALARALEAGVSWFDVAPAYGDGNAEEILGRFLVGKRSQVVLCTKVGLLPGRASLSARMAKPLAQRAVRIAPKLRQFAVQQRAPAEHAALTGALIEASVRASLQRLQTDSVDVLAVHEATLADIERADVLRALENVVSAGYAQTISMAGDVRVGLRGLGVSDRVGILQLANSPFEPNVEHARERVPKNRPVGFVSHSVYGHAWALEKLTGLIEGDRAKRELLQTGDYRGTAREMAAAFLLDFALASNREGVVLLSMYEPGHLRFNLQRLAVSGSTQTVLSLAERLGLRPNS